MRRGFFFIDKRIFYKEIYTIYIDRLNVEQNKIKIIENNHYIVES
jgi:hypothetical protein